MRARKPCAWHMLAIAGLVAAACASVAFAQYDIVLDVVDALDPETEAALTRLDTAAFKASQLSVGNARTVSKCSSPAMGPPSRLAVCLAALSSDLSARRLLHPGGALQPTVQCPSYFTRFHSTPCKMPAPLTRLSTD